MTAFAHFETNRLPRSLASLAILLAGLFVPCESRAAPPTKEIFVVEVRFALEVNETDWMKSTPQFFTTIPLANGKQFVVTWNYCDQPTFTPGGVQVQVWDNGTLLSVEEVPATELTVDGDVIRWTQKVWLSGGDCYMSLTGLSSATWGKSLSANTVVCPGTGLGNLNNFDIDSVVAESGVQHGHQRVVSFKISDFSLKDSDADKKPITDTTVRMIYATPQ